MDIRILRNWKLGDIIETTRHDESSVKRHHISYIRTGECSYVLKSIKERIRMERHVYVSNFLSEHTSYVEAPIPLRNGEAYLEYGGSFHCLYKKISGRSYFERLETGYDERFRMYGSYIGELHNILDSCPEMEIFNRGSIETKMKDWALPIVKEFSVEYEKLDILNRVFPETGYEERLIKDLERASEILPVQLIHRDLNLKNLLFDEVGLVGILDFEMAEYNIRLFDIAYFFSSITGNLDMKTVGKSDYVGALKSFISGYNLITELSDGEKNTLANILKSSELIFIAWFIKKGRHDLIENKIRVIEWLHNGYIL